MKLWSKSATALAIVALLINPTSSSASNLQQISSKSLVKVLTDHPGAATALTSKQKSEIQRVLAKGKGNQNIVCTGTSLAGQRESMYRVVLLRAQLVCEYAKSVDPSITTSIKERIVKARNLNGRVEIVSN
jgi:hypothetical protein